jgi:hypothetical protein
MFTIPAHLSASASEPGSNSSWSGSSCSDSSLPYASDFVSDYSSCVSLAGSEFSSELVMNSVSTARTLEPWL